MNARQYYNSIKTDRNAWKAEMPQRCMVTGKPCKRLEIHEILRKSQAPRSWGFRANYLLLSHEAHDSYEIASTTYDNLVTQLAIKMIRDPQHYDLELWNMTRHSSAPTFITQDTVNLRCNLLLEQKCQTGFRI